MAIIIRRSSLPSRRIWVLSQILAIILTLFVFKYVLNTILFLNSSKLDSQRVFKARNRALNLGGASTLSAIFSIARFFFASAFLHNFVNHNAGEGYVFKYKESTWLNHYILRLISLISELCGSGAMLDFDRCRVWADQPSADSGRNQLKHAAACFRYFVKRKQSI